MTAGMRLVFSMVLAACVAGCAATGNGAVTTLTRADAARAIVPGTSTRADIAQRFGQADVTRFANGYELWLYQVGYAKIVDGIPYVNLVVDSADNRRELTIQFDPAGVVRKYRLLDRGD